MASWEPDISETTASQSPVLTERVGGNYQGGSRAPGQGDEGAPPLTRSVSTGTALSGRECHDRYAEGAPQRGLGVSTDSRPESAAIPKLPDGTVSARDSAVPNDLSGSGEWVFAVQKSSLPAADHISIPKQPRKRATGKNWKRLREQKMGPCRSCGWTLPPMSLHHLVPRSLGGDDVAANLIPLCGSGTWGCHGALENHTPGWQTFAANVRESLTPVELAYCFAKKGAYFLDRYLPERKEVA